MTNYYWIELLLGAILTVYTIREIIKMRKES